MHLKMSESKMNNSLALGAFALITLTVLISISVELRSLASAWRQIADERRWNWERRIDGEFQQRSP